MTQSELETASIRAHRTRSNGPVAQHRCSRVLVLLLVGVAAYFAYTVYRDKQAQEASSATGPNCDRAQGQGAQVAQRR